MSDKYQDFLMSDEAQKLFGFGKARMFKSMHITFIIIMMGKEEEYHMMFSMSSRWNRPAIEFVQSPFSDKDRMPYGKRWFRREVNDFSDLIAVGEEFFLMEEYARFSCINHLVHSIDDESIFMLKVPGSTPILKKFKKTTYHGSEIRDIPIYA